MPIINILIFIYYKMLKPHSEALQVVRAPFQFTYQLGDNLVKVKEIVRIVICNALISLDAIHGQGIYSLCRIWPVFGS